MARRGSSRVLWGTLGGIATLIGLVTFVVLDLPQVLSALNIGGSVPTATIEARPDDDEPEIAIVTATAPPASDTSTPALTNIRFCDAPCDDAGASELTLFPEGTQQIYAQWDYAGLQPGMHYTREWSNGGQVWIHYDCVWQGPESGSWEATLREPGGLRSGLWTIRLTVEGEAHLAASVQVDGDFAFWDPAGDLPCDDF